MAVSGHSTLSQVQVYIDEVDQERAADAAITKLVGRQRSKPQQRVTNAARDGD
jgi:hypothetical protein